MKKVFGEGRNRFLSLILLCLLLVIMTATAGCRANSAGSEKKPEISLPDAGQEQDPVQGQESEAKILPEEVAMDIVLSRVDGASEDNFAHFDRDLEDGRWVYEGELIYDGIEYEFEIDAVTGNLLEWELDR